MFHFSPHHCVGFLFLACTPAATAAARPPSARPPPHRTPGTPINAHHAALLAQPTHTKQTHQLPHRHRTPTNSHQPTHTKQRTPSANQRNQPWHRHRTLLASRF